MIRFIYHYFHQTDGLTLVTLLAFVLLLLVLARFCYRWLQTPATAREFNDLFINK